MEHCIACNCRLLGHNTSKYGSPDTCDSCYDGTFRAVDAEESWETAEMSFRIDAAKQANSYAA